MSPTPIRRWCVGVLMVAATIGLGACRSGGGRAAGATSHGFSAYRQCLEQHGMTRHVPGATGTTNATEAATTAEARHACARLRPAGGLRGGGFNSGTRSAFRRCMLDPGVTLPAPGPGGTGPGTSAANVPRGGMLNGLDRHDPAVAKALTSCGSLLVSPSTSTSTRPK